MKRYIIIILDIILAGYLVFAITSFNNPEQLAKKCTKVNINITDESTYGFLDAKEIKSILEKKGLYPIGKSMNDVSPRRIEEVLCKSPFVNTAECSKTQDGHVLISLTQRSPLVRIKSETGEDYYIDENGGIMPNSKYTSDLIIVTGSVSKTFARRYISVLANTIMANDLWRNQIVQINVQHDLGIELVPRVGNHIIFLGYLPSSPTQSQRQEKVTAFATEKLSRLKNFYIYGLDSVGWNKYERIDLQFSNQIICKKHVSDAKPKPVVKPEVHEEVVTPVANQAENNTSKKEETPKAEPQKPEKKKTETKAVEVKKTDSKKQTDNKKQTNKKGTDSSKSDNKKSKKN